MGRHGARGRQPAALSVVPPVRLAHADRRQDLLDAATRLIAAEGVEAVSMETVADQAGVSRPLVYKHFANRNEILAAVYRREATLLHQELAAQVRAATTLEDMYRSLVRAAFAASAQRGALFAALRSAGAWNRELRREQQARDRRTVMVFAHKAVAEFGVPAAEAEAATAMLLTALEAVLGQWRVRRTAERAALLEETYLDVILGGLERLAERTRTEAAAIGR